MTWVSEEEGGDRKAVDGSKASARRADPGPPVRLATVFDFVEAEMIVGRLRSAGIESWVRHEALSVVYGLTFDGAGQQDIMVRAEDFEEAQAALEEYPPLDPDVVAEDEEDGA